MSCCKVQFSLFELLKMSRLDRLSALFKVSSVRDEHRAPIMDYLLSMKERDGLVNWADSVNRVLGQSLNAQQRARQRRRKKRNMRGSSLSGSTLSCLYWRPHWSVGHLSGFCWAPLFCDLNSTRRWLSHSVCGQIRSGTRVGSGCLELNTNTRGFWWIERLETKGLKQSEVGMKGVTTCMRPQASPWPNPSPSTRIFIHKSTTKRVSRAGITGGGMKPLLCVCCLNLLE